MLHNIALTDATIMHADTIIIIITTTTIIITTIIIIITTKIIITIAHTTLINFARETIFIGTTHVELNRICIPAVPADKLVNTASARLIFSPLNPRNQLATIRLTLKQHVMAIQSIGMIPSGL